MENSPEKEMLEEIRNTYLDTFPNVIFRMTERLMEKDKELADLRAQLEAAEQHVLIVREERDSYVKYKDDQIAYHVEEQAKLQALVDALVEALEKINPYKDVECSKFGCDNAIRAALAAVKEKE